MSLQSRACNLAWVLSAFATSVRIAVAFEHQMIRTEGLGRVREQDQRLEPPPAMEEHVGDARYYGEITQQQDQVIEAGKLWGRTA
jgi:hypothetical protein